MVNKIRNSARWMRWLFAGVVLAGIGLYAGEQVANATSPDPDAQGIVTGLQSYATDALSKLGPKVDDTADHLSYLANKIPLSDLAPLSNSGLDFTDPNNPLRQAINSVASNEGSVTELANALDAVNADFGGVHVTLGCGDNTHSCGHAVTITGSGPYTMTLPVSITRDVHVPLHVASDVQDFLGPNDNAHDLTIQLAATGTLSFGYDASRTANHQFFLNAPTGSPSTLTLSANMTTGALGSFPTDLGFTKVTLTPTINSANVGLDVKLTSPHEAGDSEAGVISAYDWQTTAPQDLVSVTRSGSIDASLAIDTDLTATNPDLTVHVSAAANDGFKPHFDVGGSPTDSLQSVLSSQSISDFLNVSPTKILTGLGQLAASVQALQTSANVNLPFLKDGLTSPTGGSALKIVTDLIASLAQQTVVCGSDNSTNPPSGSLLGLAAGTKVYCEATTTDTVDAGSVQWQALAGSATPAPANSNTSGAAADGTIGAAPPKFAVFQTAFDDVPPVITANYTSASAPKGVSMPVPTAQDLVNQLETTAGLGDTVAGHDAPGLSYDSDTHTLKFHLVKKIATPDPVAASFDFADRLKNSSGLFGLSADSGASVTAQAQDVVVDLTFGVILVKDLNDISTHSSPPTDLDRFFVQGPSSGPILSLADASVNATVKLAGQVGFLGITAQGASASDCASAPSAAFCLLKDDSSKPILALDLNNTGTITVASHDVDNALPIPELLSHITDHVTITPNMKLAGGLSVSADINGNNLASGGVQFTWPIDSIGELTSASQLNITTDSQFSQSLQKFWEMAKNDPTALLKIVLDALRDLAQKQATGGGGVMDTQLPLVNTTPRKLMQQFNRLETAIDEITTGSGAVVTCINVTGQAANPQRDASGAINGDHLTCQATTTSGDPTSVQWKVIAGGQLVSGTTGDTDATTVGANPSTNFAFTIPNGPSDPKISGFADGATTKGYHVHVDYSDATNSHTADLPALSAPKTLQDFADYLAAKLGLPSGVITATVIQAHKAGANGAGDPTVPTLKFGLKYDICTTNTTQVGDCGTDGLHIPALEFPISTTLGDVGGLTPSLQTTGKVGLEFNAHAEFDLGFPLDGGINTLPTPEVLGSTGGSIAVAATGDNLGAKASLGPLSVELGNLATQADPNGQTLQSFRVGGKVTLGESGTTADTDSFSPGDFISGLNIAFDNNGSASSCGQVDPDFTDDATSPDPTPPVDTTGFACAAVTMNLNGTFIGDLGIYWTDFNGSPQFILPNDLGDRIANAAFNIDFLLKALPQLLDQLKATLSNANGKQKLPIIGDALDAGANIVGQLNDNIVQPAVNGISAAIGAIGSPKQMVDKVDGFLFDHLGPSGANLLLDTNGDSSVTAADVGLKLTCKDSSNSGNPYDCSTSTNTGTGDGTVFSIQDAQIDMQLGQGIGTDPNAKVTDCADGTNSACDHSHDIPFDFGLDGLPFRVTGKLVPNVGWKAHLNFGIDRNGPYLVVNHNDNDVQIGAGIGLGDPGSGLCTQNPHVTSLLNSETDYGTFKNTNCVHGTLGFLEVTATDTDGTDSSMPRTGVQLSAGVKLVDTADSTPLKHIGLANLTDLGVHFTLKAGAHANLLIHAGIQGAGNGFPSVYGVLKANWDWGFGAGHEDPTDADTLGSNATPTPGVSFDGLRVDIGELLNNYLNPIFQQIKSVTSPLKPVIDVLQAPIPVVSQLAELVGQPPVTLIDLAEAASGSDLSFVKSIVSFLHFVDNFDISQTGLLNLDFLTGAPGVGSAGSFEVDKSLLNTPQPSTSAANLVSSQNLHASDALGGLNNANDTAMVDNRQSTFGVPGLGIPVFKDPSNVFKLLMGSNITLIDYDFGQLKATAGFEYTFGPFMVGPVPVSIVIGGSVEVHANLWIGYDTTGIREVLNGGPPDKLLDGLFFNTYRDGKEVPVIALIGTVYAGAEVDLEIIKAGIEAGLTLTVNFFFDDPTPDGKMSFEDIGSKLSNPICLFRVSGSLDAFIKAFVEIDLFFFSDRFEFTILQLHLLDFNAACDPPTPEPARVESHILKLNIGPDASKRNIQTDQKDEKIVVRPLDPSTGKQFGVTIFGAYKEYGDTNPAGADHITSIYGNGLDGKDDIELLPGAQTQGSLGGNACSSTKPCTLPFDTPAELHGGDDNDTLIGGNAGDQLYGEGGSDKITGSGGNDLLVGGGGGDQIDGGLGNDKLCSGTWSGTDCAPAAESTTESGGAGDDQLWGSTAGDQLNGGPGLDPSAKDPDHPGQTFGQTKTAELDGNDTIVGFAGTDSINGGPGDDTIYGDEVIANDFACAQAGADAPDHASDPTDQFNNDVIEAGTGSDKVWAGSGDDLVKGGSGTDGVVATGDNDFLCGNGGNDTIEGDPTDGSATGNDAVLGGPGNDILTGGPGNDYVDGGSGNDSVSGGVGDDDVVGGTGRDYVNGEDGKDIVVGESADITEYNKTTGALTIDHSGSSATMATFVSNVDETTSADTPLNCGAAYSQADATPGNSDCVSGGNNDDALFGGGGPDTMNGDAGDDWMSGGANADSMHGSAGNDVMYGDAGDDQMMGDSGDDTMFGGLDNDTMHGSTGADVMEGNQGADTMFGDEQNDHMIGGSSTAGVADQNFDFGGLTGSIGDTMSGGAGQDTMVGDNGKITGDGQAVVFDDCSATGGDDIMTGDDSGDWMFGGNGNDTMSGGGGADKMEGNAGTDTMHGDVNGDQMLGGSSNDTSPGGGAPQSYTLACDTGDNMFGDVGDDVMLGDNGVISSDGTTSQASSATGTFGNDTMRGGDGQDQMYGELGSDTMTGDAGEDYVLGDLGSITAPGSGPAIWPGGAPNHTVALIAPDDPNSGQDVMYGGQADDHMYGGGANDTVQGGGGDDYMEGNGGQDSMFGRDDNIDGSTCSNGVSAFDCAEATLAAADTSADQDDMIGGSSGVNPLPEKLDAGELIMKGNLGQDVMLGDNGAITRTVDGADPTKWAQDPITGGAKRAVTLTYSDRADCSTGVCGDDTMEGGAANDRMYGEGGNDTIDGDATSHAITGAPGDDYVEGNQNTDTIHGNDGRDDLIGGSSEIASGSGDAAVGRPDANDNVFGDAGADVIAGDNAVVSKLGVCPNGGTGDPITQRLGMTDCQRTIRLLDLTVGLSRTSTPGTFGNDALSGGDDTDVLFGQAGQDTIHGDNGDDYIEGNQDADTINGDAGQDDIIGGSSHVFSGSAANKSAVGEADAGDMLLGNDGQDVVLGDNGAILRIGTTDANTRANTLEDATKNRQGMSQRTIALYDLGDTPTAGNSGADYIEGNGDADVLLGQDGTDRIKGGTGDDYIEGNQGTDTLEGNDGDDDIVGGSSTPLVGAQAAYPGFVAPAAPVDATVGEPDAADLIYGGGGDDLITGDNGVTSRVGAAASYTLNRISTTNPGNALTPRFLQLLDLKQGGTYLPAPNANRFGADWISAGSGTDVVFGQDGNDAISGGGGDDYIEGNGGADVIRGDVLLGDTPPNDPGRGVPVVNTPESPQVAAPSAGWPGSPSSGSDLEGTGATPAGQDDIIGGSSIPAFRDAGDTIEGDGEADFVLGDNGTLARDVTGSPGSLRNTVFTARYPAGAAPANAVIIRHHDQAENVKYGTAFTSTRFCTQAAGATPTATCEVTFAFGDDRIYGDTGDDTLWGQDGNDAMRGGDGADDMYGETGKDVMMGDEGQDAMLGDRGGIVDTYINGTPGGNSTDARFPTATISLNMPPAITYTYFIAGTLDRRVDMLHDIDGAAFVGTGATNPMPLNGVSFGNDDIMRGGYGKDTMHGGIGDDIMNGDSGGDTLFGDDGADVMWGGRGCDPTSPDDPVPAGQTCAYPNDATQEGTPGAFLNTRNAVETVPGSASTFTMFDGNVDYVFGGRGGTSAASLAGAVGSDIIDWRPRGTALHPGPGSDPASTCANDTLWPAQPGTAGKKTTAGPIDPCEWLIDTNTNDDPAVSASPATDPAIQNNQTHQGIDWEYGGWDRDVLQGDVADNGPNPGDRLLDWNGAYNLYTHCNSAYGGFNDVRNGSPDFQNFILKWAVATGAGQIGTNDIGTAGTSAFDDVGFVYNSDNTANSGQAYPSTPGHFDAPNSCGL